MTVLRRLYSNRWVRYALTAALLGLVLYKADLLLVARAAGSARPAYLVGALVLTAPFLYLKALRWHLMLEAAGVRAGFGEATLALVGGMGMALVTPARLGELVRAAYLRDPQKLKIAGLVLVDKGFDVLVLTCLSVAGAWALLGAWAGLACSAISVLGLIAVYRPARILQLVLRYAPWLPLRARIDRVAVSLEGLQPEAVSRFLALTLLSFIVVLVQFGTILLSWHSWSFAVVFLTFPLVVLTNVLPITIGGLGVREATAAALLAHYGVSPAHAVLAALLMFGINTALPGLAGALLAPSALQRAQVSAGAADRP